ncbi:MAG: type II and III secretion system protein, partial [Armatimonadota bacterium]|nr:type II and III secretion system protein [Armatimonadota bacterium]
MTSLRHSCLAVIVVLLACAPAVAQRGETYCNVTEISARQLSNGVQIIIQADGEMEWWVDWNELFGDGLCYWQEGEWGPYIEFTEKFTRLPIFIHNARSKLGAGFVPIGKYPVSHVEISIPEWAHEGIGMDVDVVNYLGIIAGEGQDRHWRYNFDATSTEDGSTIIVSWESDRFPPPPPLATPTDLPTELWVVPHDGELSLHAVNATLQDVLTRISTATGFPIAAPEQDDVRVSLQLEDVSPAEAVYLVATGTGFCAMDCPEGGWIVAKSRAAAGGYEAATTRVIPLQHLKASRALDLLPTFLLDYLRVDEEANAIIANAPAWMLGRIEDDFAKLDARPPEVMVEVVAVECESTDALLRDLQIGRYLSDFSVAADMLAGGLELLWLEGLPRGWEAVLDASDTRATTRLRSKGTIRVANARTARVFAGQKRFVIIETLDEGLEAEVEPVETGTSLDLQPKMGRGDEVVLHLDVQIRSLQGSGRAGQLPVVGARRAHTTVRLRDGETIV